MSLAPGTTIGRYRVESRIGSGSMGVVYLVFDTHLERRVALKLIEPSLAADPDFRRRFEREARAAAGLDHPHVLPVYEAGEIDDQLYLAMRYVPGVDLATQLARHGALDPPATTRLVAQLAAALDAAHAAGLIHRDVKPANVLLAPDEHAYLADFGLARSAGSGITRPGQLVGTADYTAPELLTGASASPASDVYALACLAVECLTGQPPFSRADEMATLYAHANDPIPELADQRPDLAPGVQAVVERGLAKDPADRYPSAGAMAVALAGAASGRPAAAGEGAVHDRSERGVRMHERRNRRFIAPAALLVAALLAFVTVVLDASPPGPDEGSNSARPGGSPRSLEATRTQASGVPALVVGPIASGRYRTTVFSPSLEFTVPSGWSLVAETADEVSLIRTGAQGQGLFVSRFGRAIDPDAYLKTGQFESVQIVGGSNGAIDWLTGHPYLTVESRRPMLFGDVGGYAVDMRPDIPAPTVDVCALDVECLPLFVPDAGTEPIVPEPGTVIFTVFNSARYRLAFVDAGDQTVAFMIEAERDEDWIAFATSAQSILESVVLLERPD